MAQDRERFFCPPVACRQGNGRSGGHTLDTSRVAAPPLPAAAARQAKRSLPADGALANGYRNLPAAPRGAALCAGGAGSVRPCGGRFRAEPLSQGRSDVADERVTAGFPKQLDLVGQQQESACGSTGLSPLVGEHDLRPRSNLRELFLVDAL